MSRIAPTGPSILDPEAQFLHRGAGGGPAPHIHHREDEAFYIVDGHGHDPPGR